MQQRSTLGRSFALVAIGYSLACLVAVLMLLSLGGCATGRGARVPVLIGQTGEGIVDGLHQVQTTVQQLEQAQVVPTAVALRIQERVVALNTKLTPLPGLLRSIDAAQKASTPNAPQIEQALGILRDVSADLTIVVAGVPIAGATEKLLGMVRAIQMTLASVLEAVASLKPPAPIPAPVR